ncbi:amidohydrolase family protein, partial [Verrucomicrobiota bacterium]
GVAYLAVTHLSGKELMADVRLRFQEQGFVGMKPYLFDGAKYDSDLYIPCWEYADERGLYVLCHIGGEAGGMDVLSGLAARYPNMQWVVAHAGGSFGMTRQVAASMKAYPNIWAELTLTLVTNGVIEWMVQKIGDDRILFGTDAPLRDPRPQFGWVSWSDLPVESRKRILGENFKRLLSMRKDCSKERSDH